MNRPSSPRTLAARSRRAVQPARVSRAALLLAALGASVAFGGCGPEGGIELTGSLRVWVTAVDGAAPPPAEAPLAPNLGDHNEQWDFVVEALDRSGQVDPSFNGFVRLSVRPGALERVTGTGPWIADGRNIQIINGHGEGRAEVTAVFGPARLWVEDLGYAPAPPGITPGCADGIDNDDDVLVDDPNDPGCAFADDMTEEGGTFEAGISPAVNYFRPAIADVQGRGSQTPYPFVALELNAADTHYVVVTRVASSGFFVTDLADQATGFNHMYAYNFNTPWGMRVCDRVTYLSGTASEFFGFTELSFPTYIVHYHDAQGNIFGPEDCRVPEPPVLDAAAIADPLTMERQESGLVRIEGYQIATNMGPELAFDNSFGPNKSNCDLNQDGTIDYMNDAESSCSDACADEANCSEWNSFEARGNYKVFAGNSKILINTTTVFGFDPMANKGATIRGLTGTLRNFSGGKLNWTIETRCNDDLVCDFPGCKPDFVPTNTACVTFHTEVDDDEGTY